MQHKSELGGVVVGLDTEAEVRAAYRRLAALAAEHDGVVLAERMAEPGVELIVAARTDGVVPALVLGLGGIWTELLDDVAIVPLPADAARIEAALRSLRGAPVLLGARGEAGVDVAAVARLAAAAGGAAAGRRLPVIECNPVIAGAVRARWRSTRRSSGVSAVSADYDVIVVGGGFAGVTAAREAALRGRSVLLLEARDRLGGRTWSADWEGTRIEYGGAWVHWHQPHTFSELTRAGLRVELSDDAQRAGWYVGRGAVQRHDRGARRDRPARLGRFVDGVDEALPQPHDPLLALERLARFDRLTIAERIEELELADDERQVLSAELESLAHAPLDDAGAVSVLRWHALSGYSLALTQYTGGRVTIDGGTGALLAAIAGAAPFESGSARRWPQIDRSRRTGGGGHAGLGQRLRRRRGGGGGAAERARRDRVRARAGRGQAARDRARARRRAGSS